ncbi:D-aminoacylase [Candidatus Bathyarchaeota archaeon]|nr:D-aminoacylase [Candidatus Bathyarchaeota archaeon]
MVFDLIIRNGRVMDGSGNPWYHADVGITGDRITIIGDLEEASADRVIDADGMIVAPGIIDIHSHSDYPILIEPEGQSKIRQGVTTEVIGNCGSSAAPMNQGLREYRDKYDKSQLGEDFEFSWGSMKEYLDLVRSKGISFNIVPLVGHGTLRQNTIGNDNRPPTEEEYREMKRLLTKSLGEGAWGLSTGLIYTPNLYAKTDEIIELVRTIKEYDGLYTSHIRGEGDTLIEAVEEAIKIGEETGVRTQISHFKVCGSRNWGKSEDILRMIQEARDRGLDIAFDQYPYIASSTGLASILPPWAHEGGAEKLLQRIADPETREKLRAEPTEEMEDWTRLLVAHAANTPEYEGKTVQEIADQEGKTPFDAMCDMLIAEDAQIAVILYEMCEEDVQRIMQDPNGMIGSDGRAMSPDGVFGKGKFHPRYYGTFPRVLGYYVREGVLPLSEAVRKMTSAPAQRLGIKDRGLLREGLMADITVFDPDLVKDEATFIDPHRYASGIPYVIVNGVVVIDEGKHTGALPGKPLIK